LLAGAEGDLLILISYIYHWFEGSSYMGTVTEWLIGTSAASTPSILFTFFDIHYNWFFSRDYWLIHYAAPPFIICLNFTMI
jgi:hypothetical protein